MLFQDGLFSRHLSTVSGWTLDELKSEFSCVYDVEASDLGAPDLLEIASLRWLQVGVSRHPSVGPRFGQFYGPRYTEPICTMNSTVARGRAGKVSTIPHPVQLYRNV